MSDPSNAGADAGREGAGEMSSDTEKKMFHPPTLFKIHVGWV